MLKSAYIAPVRGLRAAGYAFGQTVPVKGPGRPRLAGDQASLGDGHRRAGQIAEAPVCCQIALALAPEHSGAKSALAELDKK